MRATTPAGPVPAPEYRAPTLALRVDAACDRFEAAARAGRGPRIEDYLAHAEPSWRRALLRELLLLEIELKQSAGVSPEPTAYRRRFPRDTDLVDAAFAESGPPSSAMTQRPSDPRAVPAPTAQKRAARPRLAAAAVGRYVVVEKLREGTEAVVYQVLDQGQGRDLVLTWARRPRPPCLPDRLAEEARRLTGLVHRNLVRVVDVGDHDGRPYVVTELVPGQSLKQYASRSRPTARRAATLVADLASAVAYLHRSGVVGSGVDLEDVLIDGAGRPRLTGFGLALLQDGRHDAATGRADGPGPVVGAAADVSDLGALLHELITGLPPRPSEGASAAPRRAAPRAPRALEQIGRRAVEGPADRYADAGELERALRHYLRRRGIVAASLAVAVLVLVALAACAVSFRPTPDRPVPLPSLSIVPGR